MGRPAPDRRPVRRHGATLARRLSTLPRDCLAFGCLGVRSLSWAFIIPLEARRVLPRRRFASTGERVSPNRPAGVGTASMAVLATVTPEALAALWTLSPELKDVWLPRRHRGAAVWSTLRSIRSALRFARATRHRDCAGGEQPDRAKANRGAWILPTLLITSARRSLSESASPSPRQSIRPGALAAVVRSDAIQAPQSVKRLGRRPRFPLAVPVRFLVGRRVLEMSKRLDGPSLLSGG